MDPKDVARKVPAIRGLCQNATWCGGYVSWSHERGRSADIHSLGGNTECLFPVTGYAEPIKTRLPTEPAAKIDAVESVVGGKSVVVGQVRALSRYHLVPLEGDGGLKRYQLIADRQVLEQFHGAVTEHKVAGQVRRYGEFVTSQRLKPPEFRTGFDIGGTSPARRGTMSGKIALLHPER